MVCTASISRRCSSGDRGARARRRHELVARARRRDGVELGGRWANLGCRRRGGEERQHLRVDAAFARRRSSVAPPLAPAAAPSAPRARKFYSATMSTAVGARGMWYYSRRRPCSAPARGACGAAGLRRVPGRATRGPPRLAGALGPARRPPLPRATARATHGRWHRRPRRRARDVDCGRRLVAGRGGGAVAAPRVRHARAAGSAVDEEYCGQLRLLGHRDLGRALAQGPAAPPRQIPRPEPGRRRAAPQPSAGGAPPLNAGRRCAPARHFENCLACEGSELASVCAAEPERCRARAAAITKGDERKRAVVQCVGPSLK